MKKIIETELPLKAINASAMGDKAKKGHPGNMHLWWNRSPINSSAALLEALIQEDPEDASSKKELSEKLILIAEGKESPNAALGNSNPVVYDPFSGFGGLSLAAKSIGLRTEAGDLNSVAALLTKAATEIPERFADQPPVNPHANNQMYFATEGLAMDILQYGRSVRDVVQAKVRSAYPNVKDPETGEDVPVFAWVWVRTMKCPNPACGCQMPMAPSFVLSKTKKNEFWAEPVVEGKMVRFQIHRGVCPEGKETNKFGGSGAKFRCPVCGEITKDSEVKKIGTEGKIGLQLMAICAQTKKGRIFLEPDEGQISAADISLTDDLPVGSLPNNTRWFSPPGFGFTEYVDLYTPRQLSLMDTLCGEIRRVMDKAANDAICKGLADDKVSLAEGGRGALAYSQAVGVYLALVVGRLANFQSTECTWDNRKGNIRAAFTRQAIPMTWVFAEGNPFSKVTGNYDSMLKNVVESVACLPTGGPVKVRQVDAVKYDPPKNSIMFTELPYYDNVGYADLSDYFYIWLRKILRNVYPDLFEKVVTSKEELSSIPEHFDGDSVRAMQAYHEGIEQIFHNFYGAASDAFPSIVFYEFNKEDEAALSNPGADETSFEFLLKSILNAGFVVTALWPVRTEKSNKKFDSFRIAIVFRKPEQDRIGTTRRGFINTLKRGLPRMLDTAFSQGIDEEDKPFVGLGFGLQIFSEFQKVMNADGSSITVHDLTQLIHQEVVDYILAHVEDVQSEEV